MVGILSLPRPLQIEAAVKWKEVVSVGLQYSMLPTLGVPATDASLKLNATQAVVRWFPFRGAFYLGGGFGYQQLRASVGETVQGTRLNVSVDMSTVFLSPQIGWLWVWNSGFSLGINLGVQIPLPREPVVTTTYDGQAGPGAGYPPDVMSSANGAMADVKNLARAIARLPLPNIDLLNAGFTF